MLLLCLLASPVLAEEDVGPMVMSNVRMALYPTPDVPLGVHAEDAYFEGAVLVGDSTAEPLGIYELIPPLQVLTVIGLSPRTATSHKIFEIDGEDCRLADKLLSMQPRVVYLWLGSNGVDTKPADQVIADYDRLLNVLIAAMPDTLFYLMEVTPVKLVAQEKYPNYTNARVDAFNEGLRDVARRHNVYLLSINHLLRNEKGLLDGEYGAGDGIHLRKPAYEAIAAYLYTHTIPLEEL